jgi:hypothetical protein
LIDGMSRVVFAARDDAGFRARRARHR